MVMAVAPAHFEFFSRALVPGIHYVEVDASGVLFFFQCRTVRVLLSPF